MKEWSPPQLKQPEPCGLAIEGKLRCVVQYGPFDPAFGHRAETCAGESVDALIFMPIVRGDGALSVRNPEAVFT